MAPTPPFDAVVELGRKLVSELGLDDSVDTLSRWMAHHIAELISDAEAATGNKKAGKQRECREAILELWKVRHELPNGHRPFEKFEDIFRVLAGLDPAEENPRYFSSARPRHSEMEEEKDETAQLLEGIDGLDHTARVLIRYFLAAAASDAVDKARPWVEAASKVNDASYDIRIVRLVIGETDLSKHKSANEVEREILTDRLRRLKGFVAISSVLVQELKNKLGISGAAFTGTKGKRPKKAVAAKGLGRKASKANTQQRQKPPSRKKRSKRSR